MPRLSIPVLILIKVLCDIFLEMGQLAIWNKYIGVSVFAVPDNAQQFNMAGIKGKTFKRQLNLGLASKLNL